MRNFISESDLLSWEDEGYVIGSENRGRYLPGTASKWRASEELMAMISAVNSSSGYMERRESILYGCIEFHKSSIDAKTIEFMTDYTQEINDEMDVEERSTLYGCIIPFENAIPETTRQSTQAEPPFMALMRAEMLSPRPKFIGYSWQQAGMRMAA